MSREWLACSVVSVQKPPGESAVTSPFSWNVRPRIGWRRGPCPLLPLVLRAHPSGARLPYQPVYVSTSHSNCRITISGFDPNRSGGPQVPAPLEVNTCILPILLNPYTNW